MAKTILLCLVWLVAGPALAQTEIRFSTPGAPKDLRGELLSSSLLFQASRESTQDPEELLAASQADYARLLGVLYANARYGGVISILIDGREAAGIEPLNAPSSVERIVVEISPGPLYLFSEVQAAPLTPATELPEGFTRGLPAGTDSIRAAADAAVQGWRAEGHAKARIADQQITARHAENRISAVLSLAPGPKLSFGAVDVEGNRNVRTRRILTIAGLEEGRVYDPAEIDRALRRLRRTGSFQSVTVSEADAIGANDTLPLTIGVVEQTPRRFGFGAEYSTVEGVRLSGFWLHRNLLGGAERFRVEGEIAGLAGETGGSDYKLGIRYERPATPRADVDLFTSLEISRLKEPLFASDSIDFNIGFTRYATDDLIVEFGIGALYADTEEKFDRSALPIARRSTIGLLTLPLGATLDRRDDPLNAKKGIYADLDLVPFYAFSGTDSGVRLALDTRGYRTFGRDGNVTAAARIQLGSLFGPSLLESPSFYRFSSGGGGTVRGQDYQSLTVSLPGGRETGGRSFLGLSGELRASVTENIDVVGFADWGYIGAESFPDLSGESHAGAGLGLRYNTGIGPIRLDVATPIAGDTPASDFYIYLGIGQAF